MIDPKNNDIAAEEYAILLANNNSYSSEIDSYIKNGRAFFKFSDKFITEYWLEIVLSNQLLDANAAILRSALEIEHLLRGLTLPYDRLIDAGGEIFNISIIPPAADFGLALRLSDTEPEQTIDKEIAKLRERHVTRLRN